MCFSESIVIGASPEAAFAYLADPETATAVDPAVMSYQPERVPMRPGTLIRVRARMFAIPVTLTTKVRVWEEDRCMVMELIRPAHPLRAVATHKFEPHPDGVRYTWSMEFTPNGLGGRLLAPVVSSFMRRNAAAQQARFKRIMETAAAAGPP